MQPSLANVVDDSYDREPNRHGFGIVIHKPDALTQGVGAVEIFLPTAFFGQDDRIGSVLAIALVEKAACEQLHLQGFEEVGGHHANIRVVACRPASAEVHRR